MTNNKDVRPSENAPPPVYVVSGGVGASGEQLVHTALAQFPNNRVAVITVGNVRRAEEIESVVAQAKSDGGMIVHTLVDVHLRQVLIDQAEKQGVFTLDLIGPLLSQLAVVLNREPLGHPGMYRQLHQDYFDRVGAIEFSMAHDDGRDPSGWSQAEIMLVGVSRAGKTPLSLYLSVLGWKVANLPLVPGVPPPPALFQLDPRRVIGLTIEPGQLLLHRQQRQKRLGAPGPSSYVDPQAIYEEIQAAVQLFRKGGFVVVDVTDKPIESTADEIMGLINRASPALHSHGLS